MRKRQLQLRCQPQALLQPHFFVVHFKVDYKTREGVTWRPKIPRKKERRKEFLGIIEIEVCMYDFIYKGDSLKSYIGKK